MPSKRGRPCTYTTEVADLICAGLASGKGLYSICKKRGMPPEATVRGWVLDDHEGFAAKYVRARGIGLDCIADGSIDISDKCRLGEKIEKKEVGRTCSECGQSVKWRGGWKHQDDDNTVMCQGAKAEPLYEYKTVTVDMVERARLQVDTRKWLLSKLRPEKYGDRSTVEMSAPGGGPLNIKVEFVDAKKEAEAE